MKNEVKPSVGYYLGLVGGGLAVVAVVAFFQLGVVGVAVVLVLGLLAAVPLAMYFMRTSIRSDGTSLVFTSMTGAPVPIPASDIETVAIHPMSVGGAAGKDRRLMIRRRSGAPGHMVRVGAWREEDLRSVFASVGVTVYDGPPASKKDLAAQYPGAI